MSQLSKALFSISKTSKNYFFLFSATETYCIAQGITLIILHFIFWKKESEKKNVCVYECMLVTQSCLTVCDPLSVARQAPLSMEFSWQLYGSG